MPVLVELTGVFDHTDGVLLRRPVRGEDRQRLYEEMKQQVHTTFLWTHYCGLSNPNEFNMGWS